MTKNILVSILFFIFMFHMSYGKKDTLGSNSFARFSACQHNEEENVRDFNEDKLKLIPGMSENKTKGHLGVIGIMGGISDTIGALSFAGLGALRLGADVVHIFMLNPGKRTEWLYPDFVMHHHTTEDFKVMLEKMQKMDVILLGPGLDNVNSNQNAVIKVIEMCSRYKIPLILNLDEYFHANGVIFNAIKNYPEPGVIVMLNSQQFEKVYPFIKAKEGFSDAHVSIDFDLLGPNVLIYRKGCVDMAFTMLPANSWSYTQTDSKTKRSRGQGSVIAGMTATYFNWALKYHSEIFKGKDSILKASSATYAAAQVMRESNKMAVFAYSRNAITSDMIGMIKNVVHIIEDEEAGEEEELN